MLPFMHRFHVKSIKQTVSISIKGVSYGPMHENAKINSKTLSQLERSLKSLPKYKQKQIN